MLQLEIYTHTRVPIKATLPEGWDELSTDQMARIAEALHTCETDTQILVQCAFVLLRLPKNVFMHIGEEAMATDVLPLLEWLRKPYSDTRQRMPVVKAGFVSYYGPADELGNLTAEEFDFLEHALKQWAAKPGDKSRLFEFAAILYRPKKSFYNLHRDKDGDPRRAFNDNLVKYYARQLEKYLPIRYVYAMLLYYKACRQQWVADHPRIFTVQDGGGANAAVDGYYPLLRAIAEKGTYGDFDKVCGMYMVNLLNEMELMLDDNERLKREIEKLNAGHGA